MSNRFYYQQANASNPLRAYQICQDSIPCIVKSQTIIPSSATLTAAQLGGGLISTTGASAITLTFATGSQLLQEFLPSNLLYTGSAIVGNPLFGISPASSQSLPLGAEFGPVEVVNAGSSSGAITYSAGDSSFDISLLQPATQAINTSKKLSFLLSSVNPVIWKVIG